MKSIGWSSRSLAVVAVAACGLWAGSAAAQVKIGFNVPLTGDGPSERANRRVFSRPTFENVSTRLRVQITDNPRATYVALVDRAGTSVWTGKGDGAVQIDGPTLPPGTYAVRVGASGVVVGEGSGNALRVPLLATRGAGLTADAGVEIDDEAELFRGRHRKRGHAITSLLPGNVSKRGQVWPASSGSALVIATIRSYQAAWPVIGSALAKR